jgi:energy-coupling factor transporter ATP-binding protein EcfA2
MIKNQNANVSYFATTNGRPPYQNFGIYQTDRLQHVYVLGQTGTGKSTLLQTLFMQDVINGRGCILLDPHGDMSSAITRAAPQDQLHRLRYIDLASGGTSYGYNPLKSMPASLIPSAASGLLETFRHHFGEKAWGSRMEHIFRNVLYALLEYQEGSLADILRMLSEKDFRAEVLAHVRNPQVRYFWEVEFTKLWGSSLFEAIAPIQSKVGAFLTDPKLRAFLLDFDQSLSFRRAMDDGQIIIINLARGVLGADTSSLLGSLMTQTIALAALSRQSTPTSERRPCHLYLDEFEHLLTAGTAGMLSEVRKVGLSVTLANQYLHQLPSSIQAAVLGNVGTIISFRTGPEDARLLTRIFGNEIDPADIMNLPNYQLYVRLLIGGEPSRVFSGRVMRPIEMPTSYPSAYALTQSKSPVSADVRHSPALPSGSSSVGSTSGDTLRQ